MFGQSFLVKLAIKNKAKKIAKACGANDEDAKIIGSIFGWTAGILVGIKTFDFPGIKAMVVGEVIENGAEEVIEESLEEGVSELVVRTESFTDLSSVGYINHEILNNSWLSKDVVSNWVNTIAADVNHPFFNIAEDFNPNVNAFINHGSFQFGDEVIHYNPEFMESQYEKHGTGAFVGILAHEVGHSAMIPEIPTDPSNKMFVQMVSWSNEQNADYFAGSVLAKFNLNINEFLNSLVETGIGSETHPDGLTRASYALRGYLDNGGVYPLA